jgi:hypothetical protein
VQVLERIVTDRGYDIATQIEALRDSAGSMKWAPACRSASKRRSACDGTS